MKLNAHTIILSVVVLILLYLVYLYFFAGANTVILKLRDARTSSTISPNSLSSSPNSNYHSQSGSTLTTGTTKLDNQKLFLKEEDPIINQPLQ